MELEVQITRDGSATLLNKALNATYHSHFGAIQESMHIYIHNGLQHVAQRFGNKLKVLEMGFGTGLNALLSLQEAERLNLRLRYTSLEKYPVPAALYQQLNYAQNLSETIMYQQLLACSWEQPVQLTEHFTLLKHQTDINDFVFRETYHVIYYDAFDPQASPESWQPAIFERLFRAMPSGACLVTFCAKGLIRRLLKQTGFIIESLPGPPGKREITRAIKP